MFRLIRDYLPALTCLVIGLTSFGIAIGAAVADASPFDNESCGTTTTPACAGPSPFTPEQICGGFTYFTFIPCNWVGIKVPEGTPGSLN